MLKRLDPGQYRPANGADYPRGKLGKALLEIAQLIRADVGLQVAFADVTGWDTHVNQGASEGQLAGRLDELGQALAAFTRDLGERMRDVVVLTMSEFGRTVRENGNSGTDHGHATAMLVLGGPLTPIVTPLRKSCRTRGSYTPAPSSFRKRATSRPRSPAYSIRYSPSSANCRSNKRSCISQNLPCAPAASAASAACCAWGWLSRSGKLRYTNRRRRPIRRWMSLMMGYARPQCGHS